LELIDQCSSSSTSSFDDDTSSTTSSTLSDNKFEILEFQNLEFLHSFSPGTSSHTLEFSAISKMEDDCDDFKSKMMQIKKIKSIF